MNITAFHPILYVDDPYAERDFFALFGFETTFEGEEFPGFLAVRCGQVAFGLSGNRELTTGSHNGVRWQLMVQDVGQVAAVCEGAGLAHEIVTETGGTTHRTQILKVTSPGGVPVWFESPNQVS